MEFCAIYQKLCNGVACKNTADYRRNECSAVAMGVPFYPKNVKNTPIMYVTPLWFWGIIIYPQVLHRGEMGSAYKMEVEKFIFACFTSEREKL